jgi:NADPH:quinone reductase-like Zn-dependent oxidoreductase
MKAVYLIGHGGNEVVTVGERPMPLRQPGEVLGLQLLRNSAHIRR